MRHLLFAGSIALTLIGCNKPQPAAVESHETPQPTRAAAAPARPLPDACTLLTSDEVKSVLGEGVEQTKPSGNPAAQFAMAQCYFALPTAVNSMVLTLLRTGPGGGDLREWWNDTFHKEHPEREEEQQREGRGEREGEAGEKKAKPLKVDGVGDEAFWTGTAVGGALYVLNGDTAVRVSVGGKDDQQTKIDKSRRLAAMALKRL